jgi:hypothetical protein
MSTDTTPAALYAMKPQTVTYNLYDLNGFRYQHVPELDLTHAVDEENGESQRVERRILIRVDHDERRYWELATVWFGGKPIMVTQNAGREGDDHHARFVTDPVGYGAMVGYLMTLRPALPTDVVLADEPRDDLLSFYGGTWEGEL